MPSTDSLARACALAIALAAGAIDARTGSIPNWLTLPALAVAPLVRSLAAGPGALSASLLGAGACALVPLFLFRAQALGGGDVKLFVALGAWLGANAGLELQLSSFTLSAAYGLARAVHRAELRATLRESWLLLRIRGSAARHTLETDGIRLGPAIGLAACMQALLGAGS